MSQHEIKFAQFLSTEGQDACKTCPAGYYCLEGAASPTPCSPGTYNPSTMQGSATSCRPCKSGFACPLPASIQPTEMCSAGYYCPAGSSLPNEALNACPAGTYTDYHNLTADSECDKCPAGQACPSGTGGAQTPPLRCAEGIDFTNLFFLLIKALFSN